MAPGLIEAIPIRAKQRLLTEGPLTPGTQASLLATIAVAAELRLQGVTQDDALRAVRAMPLTPASTPLHRLRKQQIRAVRFAYGPPNGDKILTGCCRDPRPRSGNRTTSTLRDQFQGYCDAECEATCGMLRAIRAPERALWGTPYELVVRSNLWVHGAHFGVAGREVYCLVAGQAIVRRTDEVQASSRFIAMKLDGLYSDGHIRRVLRAFHKSGLITLLDKRTGMRRIAPPSPEALLEIEGQLGVKGRRAANIREARLASDTYRDWLAEVFKRHGDVDAALAAWDPPA